MFGFLKKKESVEVDTIIEEENVSLSNETKNKDSFESKTITRRNDMKVTYNLENDELFDAVSQYLENKFGHDIEDLDFEIVIDGKPIPLDKNSINAISYSN